MILLGGRIQYLARSPGAYGQYAKVRDWVQDILFRSSQAAVMGDADTVRKSHLFEDKIARTSTKRLISSGFADLWDRGK